MSSHEYVQYITNKDLDKLEMFVRGIRPVKRNGELKQLVVTMKEIEEAVGNPMIGINSGAQREIGYMLRLWGWRPRVSRGARIWFRYVKDGEDPARAP